MQIQSQPWFAPQSSTAPASTAPASTTPEHPESAGMFKRMGDSVSQMFSDMAFGLKMGETYKLIQREFQQIDYNGDSQLNLGEFTMGTLNPFDFQAADRDFDGRVNLKEYASYRKDRLEAAFNQRDTNRDRHINVAEIGSVGRIYLAQRNPNVDLNQDGLLNRREFMRANLTLGINIRDAFGF